MCVLHVVPEFKTRINWQNYSKKELSTELLDDSIGTFIDIAMLAEINKIYKFIKKLKTDTNQI